MEYRHDRESCSALIERAPLFMHLPEPSRNRLAEQMTGERHPAGAVLVREGDAGDKMFLIAEGTAEVTVQGAEKVWPVASLGPGDTFGELALLAPGGTRAATVTALTPVALLSITRREFHTLLAAHADLAQSLSSLADQLLTVSFLKQATPFAALGVEQLRELIGRVSRRSAAAGETIMRQGEPGDVAYLIRDGKVDVVMQGEAGERRLATLGRGAMVGEAALLAEHPRNATVRAVEASEFLVLHRADLMWAMEQDQGIGGAMLWLLNSRDRPSRVAGIEAHHRQTAEGSTVTVLKDPARHAYYRLSEHGWFVWQRLDRRHTLRMLTLDYLAEFKSFAPAAIATIVAGLAFAGFVSTQSVKAQADLVGAPTRWDRIMAAAARALTWQLAIENVDGVLGAIYRGGAHVLFTRPAQMIFGLLAAAGLGALLFETPAAGAALHDAGGTNLLWAIPLFLLVVLIHEMGHALTVKAFGREVPRVGVGWYWFGPIAFIDTSDMWIAGTWPRIAVTLAGAWINAVTGGLVALVALAVRDPAILALCWIFALFSFLTVVVNANPLLEYDGYYVLADLLDRPNLRPQALARLGALLSGELSLRDAWQQHRIDLVFGVGSLAYIIFMAGLTLVSYRVLLGGWVSALVSPVIAAILAWAVTIAVAAASCMAAAGEILAGARQKTGAMSVT